jgi:hypothetical protein
MDKLVIELDIDAGQVQDAGIYVRECVGDTVLSEQQIGLCQMITVQAGVDVPASITAVLKDCDKVSPLSLPEYKSILERIGARVVVMES